MKQNGNGFKNHYRFVLLAFSNREHLPYGRKAVDRGRLKYPLVRVLNIFYRIKRSGIVLVNNADDRLNIFSFNNREQHFYRPHGPMCIHNGNPIIFLFQGLNQLFTILVGDDTDNL